MPDRFFIFKKVGFSASQPNAPFKVFNLCLKVRA